MSDLRKKVARAIAQAAHGGEYPPDLYFDEADAAIAAVLDALKEPSEAMILAGERAAWDENASMPMHRAMAHGYAAMIQAFTRNHYLSALAEEDGKTL